MINPEKFPHIPLEGEGGQEEAESPEAKKLLETYRGSKFLDMLGTQEEDGKDRTALFTDVDNTFQKAGREAAMESLTTRAEKESIPIIVITGNDYQGIKERIESGELPAFQVIVGSVGTEIWVLHQTTDGETEYKKDGYFEDMLKESGFVRPKLIETAKKMVNELKSKFPEWQLDFQHPDKEKELEQDPDPDYQTFKISFYFFTTPEKLSEVETEINKYFPEYEDEIINKN